MPIPGIGEQALEVIPQTDLPEERLFDLSNLAGKVLDGGQAGHD